MNTCLHFKHKERCPFDKTQKLIAEFAECIQFSLFSILKNVCLFFGFVRFLARSLFKMSSHNPLLRLEQRATEADQIIEYLKQQVQLLKEKTGRRHTQTRTTRQFSAVTCILPNTLYIHMYVLSYKVVFLNGSIFPCGKACLVWSCST